MEEEGLDVEAGGGGLEIEAEGGLEEEGLEDDEGLEVEAEGGLEEEGFFEVCCILNGRSTSETLQRSVLMGGRCSNSRRLGPSPV